ncbi:probable prolyl 4-hydroxylase 10 [Lathyrus oleraceus]|uniref:procollagen-proline 4-dioxygenase n=1 Tax=Pisum sativum TaxID=3888 RepID=A0A9D4XD24_PEA|nr:probable prolyl 4-hydroxylase 10 [Pisum sativum]KAI5418769.1 hypothetical protein KIW84_043118 [Pisum sativum]
MVKLRHSRVGLLRPSLTTLRTLILTLAVAFTFLILILLTLTIPKSNHLNSVSHRNTLRNQNGKEEVWVETISWEPRAFLHHNFLTKEECEHIIRIAKPSMSKSSVVDNKTGKSFDSSVRTSSGTFLQRGHDQIVRNIEKRIADFTHIPVEHGEPLQVLRYKVGQKYAPHYDYFGDKFNTRNGGNRMATMLMYLSDVEEGGETVFPNAKGDVSSVPWWNELSDCGKEGLSVKPKMGDAILFWSMKPNTTLDPFSLHGACPVIKGDKWSSAKWMRVNKYVR